MNGIDQIIVALWFLPVVLFIVIPLSVACLSALVSLLSAFLPVAGQQRSAVKMRAASAA